MPDKVVQVPGVGNVSFPDSMADEDIATAISSHMNSGPPATHGIWDKANEYAGKALSAAGLPKSIADVPDWFKHLTGTHKDSQPFWEPVRNAIKNPTQENIVAAVPFVGPAAVSMSNDVRAGDYGGAAATLAGTVAGVKAAGQVQPGLKALNAETGIGAKATQVGQDAARKLYQGALKPPPGSYSLPEVNQMVDTGLKGDIPVSQEGVARLGGLITNLNKSIRAQIEAGSDAGATVNKFSVASRLKSTAQKFETQVNPESDLNAVAASGNEFLRNQPNEIPALRAQDLKSGTYKQLSSKAYGELGTAVEESQKGLARGIKEELAEQFPEIKGMNAQESKFLGLDEALQRAVRRINNRDVISLGDKIVAGAGAVGGAAVSGGPGAAAGAAASAAIHHVLLSPEVQSKIAIWLNHKGTVPFSAARARVAAYTNAIANAAPVPNQSQTDGTQ